MTTDLEPVEAFPYMPPTEKVRLKYSYIFDLDKPLPLRFFKLIFDKTVEIPDSGNEDESEKVKERMQKIADKLNQQNNKSKNKQENIFERIQ